MGKLTLLLGGARSGKSTLAQRLAARRGGAVLYIATARVLDEEMEVRVRTHRSDRPGEWRTLEAPVRAAQAAASLPERFDVALLDCLTMLVTNVLLDACPGAETPDEQTAAQAVDAEIDALLDEMARSDSEWIIVSNEVGLGLVPPYPLGRLYRDLLGRANQRLAAAADEVLFLVAGIPVPIHDFRLTG